MFTVYVLYSKTSGRYYIGYTSNLPERLLRHNAGRERYTKYSGPWEVVYQESFSDRSKAMAREKEIKSYKGGNAFKQLIRPETEDN